MVDHISRWCGRWTLLPPPLAEYGALPVREWHLTTGPAALRDERRAPLECVQLAGDVLYIPDHWGHAVLNDEPSVGYAAEVATARGHPMQVQVASAPASAMVW